MTNVLIIGGSGCIGTEASKWLTKTKNADKIVCASRGVTALTKSDGIIYEKTDITDLDSLVAAMIKHEITHVLHTAALRTTACNEDPKLATDINVTGTGNVYEAAQLSQTVKRVVFLSTAAVYDQVESQQENVNEEAPIKGYATYVATKIAGEDLAKSYCHQYDIEIVAVRPQILFGPSRGSEGSTAGITNAVRAIAKGEKFTIPFSSTYAFHYTGDIAPLLGATLLKPVKEKFSIYNLPGSSIDVKDISEILNSLAGQELIDFETRQYPFAKSVSYEKFSNDFGAVQLTPFKEAFAKTFEFFKNQQEEK
jgi:nucleoside-diphosphate-sugar epimerase